MKKKNILFICTRHSTYTRNEFFIKQLLKAGNLKCLFYDHKYYFLRLACVAWKIIILKNKKKYNVVVVGFLAQPILPLVRLYFKQPIIADFFLSLYDTICYDRKIFKPNSIVGKLIYKFEKWCLSISDYITTDTETHLKYFIDKFNANINKSKIIYVLANTDIFFNQKKSISDNKFRIFTYATCLPVHGIETILRAVSELAHLNLFFTLVGPLSKKYQCLIDNLKLPNVNFVDYVEYKKLPNYIKESDVCLGGHFGITNKAERTIAGKTFQFISMKKPVILGNSLANQELFRDEYNCLMVPRDDPNALAGAIIRLYQDRKLLNKIRDNASRTILSVEKNTKTALLNLVNKACSKN